MRDELKYGWRKGPVTDVVVTLTASQTIKAKSGRFVYQTSGAMTLNTDGSTRIFGFLDDIGDYTTVSGDRSNCNINLASVFRVPVISGTMAIGMIGDTTDLNISSNIQGVQLGASTENTVMVVGGDTDTNEYCDVVMVGSVQGTGSGTED